MDSTRVPGTCILRKLSYLHQSIIALFTGIIPLLHSTGELININFTGQPFSRPTPVKRLNLFHREFIIIPVTGEHKKSKFTGQCNTLCPTGEPSILYIHLNFLSHQFPGAIRKCIFNKYSRNNAYSLTSVAAFFSALHFR